MTNDLTMTNTVIESLVSRSTTSHYDPGFTLTDDQIANLIRIATTAPTSFHLQNWRFIAVRTPEAKARLRPIAWDQPKITAAAVTFIICGQLPDHMTVPERLAPRGGSRHHAGRGRAAVARVSTRFVRRPSAAPTRRSAAHRFDWRDRVDLCGQRARSGFDADHRVRRGSGHP